jgi:hypothetical protein
LGIWVASATITSLRSVSCRALRYVGLAYRIQVGVVDSLSACIERRLWGQTPASRNIRFWEQ